MSPDPIDLFAKSYQEFHSISPERRRQQLQLLRSLEATLDGRSLLECTGDEFAAFAGDIKASGLHVNTVRKKLNMIRPFFSWAYATQKITADQYLAIRAVKNPRGSTGRSKPDPYTKAELQAFWPKLAAALPLLPESGRGSRSLTRFLAQQGGWNGHLYRHAMRLQIDAMVHLAFDCGLRRTEIFDLSLADLHYDNEYIVVFGKADPNTGQQKVRSVPFTTEARESVKRWLEFRAWMRPLHDRPWLSCFGRAYRNPMWFTRFKDLLQTTVGPEYRWHRFRHTCATHWLRSGVELEVVSRLLGHSTLQQTLAYAKIVKDDIGKSMSKGELRFADMSGKEAA
jgi:site-specific recombinase XerD